MELYPSVEPAFEIARKYLTAKEPGAGDLEDFRARMAAIKLSDAEIDRLCDRWAEEINNAGRLSVDQAKIEAERRKNYAKGHFERMLSLMDGWLRSAAFPESRSSLLRFELAKLRGV